MGERRMEKVDGLENEVLNMKIEKENEEMKEQVKNLHFKLDLQLKSKPKEKPKSLPIQLNQFEPITPVCNIPDELFTPNGSFVLNTPKGGIVNFQFPKLVLFLKKLSRRARNCLAKFSKANLVHQPYPYYPVCYCKSIVIPVYIKQCSHTVPI